MTESELRERLRATPVPADPAAEERAWRVVKAAYAPALAGRASRSRRRRLLPVLVSLIAVAAFVLSAGSAPREALARWFRDALGLTAQPQPRPVLAGLPSGGRLLVNAPSGPWIVGPNGTRTHLGAYAGAAWSPHSLYVVAWRADRLVALNPRGRRQWAIAAGATVSAARWSPDGYRIAYLAGQAVDVVAGDGSQSHRLLAGVRPIAPAWQPRSGTVHRLAFVDGNGDVQLRDADTGALLWRVRPPAAPDQLLWSATGKRLLVIARRTLVVFSRSGRRLAVHPLAPATSSGAAVLGAGDRLAVVIRRPALQPDSIELLTATAAGLRHPARIVFTAAERLSALAWSPDARWLLAASSSADQWIFLRLTGLGQITAVSQIARKFRAADNRAPGFPALAGWQP